MKKKEKLNYDDVVKFIIIHQFNNSQGWGEVWTIDFLAEHLSHTPKQKEKIKEYYVKHNNYDYARIAKGICRILRIKSN